MTENTAARLTPGDLIRLMPYIQVRGGYAERSFPGKEGKPPFVLREMTDCLLCVVDGEDVLKQRCHVPLPGKRDPYLPGRYLFSGAGLFEVGAYGRLELNSRELVLISIDDVDGLDETAAGGVESAAKSKGLFA